MGYCCVSCEVNIVCTRNGFFILACYLIHWFGSQVLYIVLFLLAKNQTENLTEVSLIYVIASFLGSYDTNTYGILFSPVIFLSGFSKCWCTKLALFDFTSSESCWMGNQATS